MLAQVYWLASFLQPEEPAGRVPRGGGGGAEGGGGPGGCLSQSGSLIMLAVMFIIFYFLLIRPQQKRAREHDALLKGLKVGERVITTGGLVGKISGLTDRYVTLEIAEKVRVRVVRANIAGLDVPETPPAEKGKA